MNIEGGVGGIIRILGGGTGGGELRSQLHIRERFTGEIIESGKGDTYFVRLKGMTILAKSSLPLIPGKTYLFQAETLDPRIELKTVLPGNADASSKWSFLKALNLPADSLHYTALELLLTSGAIPSKEDVLSLAALANSRIDIFPPGTPPEEALRILFIIENFSLPARRGTAEALLSFIRGEATLGEALKNFSSILRLILGNKAENSGLNPGIIETAGEIELLLAQIFSASSSRGARSEPFRFYSLLGIFYERELRNAFLGKGGEENGPLQSLKAKLLKLLAEISGEGAAPWDAEKKLAPGIRSLLDRIEDAQILKEFGTKSGWTASLLHIPIEDEGGRRFAPVLFQRKAGPGKKKSFWKLHLSLCFENAGNIYLNLSGIGDSISAKITTDNEEFAGFLREECRDLPELIRPFLRNLRQVAVVFSEELPRIRIQTIIEDLFANEQPVNIMV